MHGALLSRNHVECIECPLLITSEDSCNKIVRQGQSARSGGGDSNIHQTSHNCDIVRGG